MVRPPTSHVRHRRLKNLQRRLHDWHCLRNRLGDRDLRRARRVGRELGAAHGPTGVAGAGTTSIAAAGRLAASPPLPPTNTSSAALALTAACRCGHGRGHGQRSRDRSTRLTGRAQVALPAVPRG